MRPPAWTNRIIAATGSTIALVVPASVRASDDLPAAGHRQRMISAIQDHWQNTDLISVRGFFLGLAAVLILLAIIWTLRQMSMRRAGEPGVWLFQDVARQLGLGLSQRLLLMRIARQQQLPSALTLVLSPRTLAHHSALYADQLSRRRAGAVKQRVTQISVKLFGPSAGR